MKKLFIALVSFALLASMSGCKKEKDKEKDNDIPTPQQPEFGTVTDIDGNTYKTVKIGTQIWMMENLKTAHYNDGTAIPTPASTDDWEYVTTGAYCYLNNDASYNTTYGKMYNWFSVSTGKLAPAGWHVPTDAEWQTLIDFLGGQYVAGGKMKSTSLWNSQNTGADNSSYFTALPAGYVGITLDPSGLGSTATYWSSSEYASGSELVWVRTLHNYTASVDRINFDKNQGYSVRCVKD